MLLFLTKKPITMDSIQDYCEHVMNGGILDRTERNDFLTKVNQETGTNHRDDETMANIYHVVKSIVEPEEFAEAFIAPELTEEEKKELAAKFEQAWQQIPAIESEIQIDPALEAARGESEQTPIIQVPANSEADSASEAKGQTVVSSDVPTVAAPVEKKSVSETEVSQ